jgi:misacylated tRNA(Ala) deacylase
MTELLFHTDSYLREFEAEVVGVDAGRNAVLLDRTAFYAGGGGQPCDIGELGTIGAASPPEAGATPDAAAAVTGAASVPPEGTASAPRWQVTGVKKEGKDVLHFLAPVESAGSIDEPPGAGDRVTGAIAWERRYRLMRTHTAMHILCGVVWRDYGAQVTGGNMEPLEGRMDFEFESLQRELVDEIEAKINAEVEAAREVRVKILPRAEAETIPDLIRTKINLVPAAITEIRTVEIVGLDLQADGGTHVANTREVGPLRILDYKSKGRINKRIRIGLEERPAPPGNQ